MGVDRAALGVRIGGRGTDVTNVRRVTGANSGQNRKAPVSVGSAGAVSDCYDSASQLQHAVLCKCVPGNLPRLLRRLAGVVVSSTLMIPMYMSGSAALALAKICRPSPPPFFLALDYLSKPRELQPNRAVHKS